MQKLFVQDELFRFLRILQKKYPSAGVYVVGGAVRDALRNKKSKDYDFVVRSIPIQKLAIFLAHYGIVNHVGRRFGVLKFIPDAAKKKQSLFKNFEPFDIALPRQEFSIHHSGHYRDFSVKSDHRLSIEDDLSRRDFTMNAIAYDIRKKVFVDPFGGMQDILKKIIRTVGDPKLRFEEDYSRMLRALRFSCQFGYRIEKETSHAIKNEMIHINKKVSMVRGRGKKQTREHVRAVPYEVIAKEMVRTFSAHSVGAFDMYDEYGVFDAIFPEMIKMKGCPQPSEWHSEGDVWSHSRFALAHLFGKRFQKEFGVKKPDNLLIFAMFLHDIGKPYTLKTPEKDGVDRIRFDGHDRVGAQIASAIITRLRLSSVVRSGISPEKISWLIKNHLLLLNSDLKTIKNNTLEKYFFKDRILGQTLQKLMFTDALASVRADGKTTLTLYYALKRRLAKLGTMSEGRVSLPKPILNGNEIMKVLNVQPGPYVGVIVERLREEQLSGNIQKKKQALLFLKKNKNALLKLKK
ncbi:CCA tRNA nucleotidyltransferase [Candidatus Uhrbacteria bacterium]|nr:CCA tRNA nucleotidyltransferase [Candidatus Uhrbacteria bacterium]